jgi:predicted NACHT family NTPase
MARTSIRASQEGRKRIQEALNAKGWNKAQFLEEARCEIPSLDAKTVNRFINGENVDNKYFRKFCSVLGLKVEEILDSCKSTKDITSEASEEIVDLPQAGQDRNLGLDYDKAYDISTLVKETRQKIRSYIQEKCGYIRVLGMEKPIELGRLYTNVNLLEERTKNRRLSVPELQAQTSHRVSVPGLEILKKHEKLIIFGKPGSGKTTFLKHLAVYYSSEEVNEGKVPIFISLRELPVKLNSSKFLDYIRNIFSDQKVLCSISMKNDLPIILERLAFTNISEFPPFSTFSQFKELISEYQYFDSTPWDELLKNGRFLFLLDGLDEVREEAFDSLIGTIKYFVTYFSKNQYIITCRIASRETVEPFENFAEVEVADFDYPQIKSFVENWFFDEEIHAESFLKQIKDSKNLRIKKLAENPLLLTLICLIFKGTSKLVSSRLELYQESSEILLKKWDKERRVIRDSLFVNFPKNQNEALIIDLLSQISNSRFKNDEYLFRKNSLVNEIEKYLENLSKSKPFEIDGEAVLELIESHHGFLVEQANGIYAFSHLSFQEYFTAKYVERCFIKPAINELSFQIIETRWKEVFLLLVDMPDIAEKVLRWMKEEIDNFISNDEEIQRFLIWVYEKSYLDSYTSSGVRMFYFTCFYEEKLTRLCNDILERFNSLKKLVIDLNIYCKQNQDESRFDTSKKENPSESLKFVRGQVSYILYDIKNKTKVIFNIINECIQTHEYIKALNSQDRQRLSGNPILKEESLNNALDNLLKRQLNCKEYIKELIDIFPDKNDDSAIIDFCNKHGSQLIKHIQNLKTQFIETNSSFSFTDAQIERLERYCKAKKILIECLNSSYAINQEIKNEITNTLIFPILRTKNA